MLGGSRIRIPGQFLPYAVGFEEAQERMLALEVGGTINAVQTPEEMQDIFTHQARLLIANWAGNVGPDLDAESLRNVDTTHKREADFWAEEANYHYGNAQLRVLVPFAPQYGLMHSLEVERQRPSHMTFGLKRPFFDLEGSLSGVTVARTNIWLMRDGQSPFDDAVYALKDTNNLQTFDTERRADAFLNSRARKRFTSQFVVAALSERLRFKKPA